MNKFFLSKLQLAYSHLKILLGFGGGLTREDEKVLTDSFTYYRKLSSTLRKMYLIRAGYFMRSKQFVQAEGGYVSHKTRLLIAGYAAQMTLGLEDYSLPTIHRIVICPGRFFSETERRVKRWDVSEDGIVRISLRDLLREVEDETRLFPIGLKVMANVLVLENERQNRFGFQLFQKAKAVASEEYMLHKQREVKDRLFRDVDLQANDRFFFSCVVHFFCKPDQLKNRYPALYRDVDSFLHGSLVNEKQYSVLGKVGLG